MSTLETSESLPTWSSSLQLAQITFQLCCAGILVYLISLAAVL